MLVAGALGAAVVAVVVIVLSGGGNGGSGGARSHSGTVGHGGAVEARTAMHVAVLNSTETNGLAHHFAASLQQKGFAHAKPLDGRPEGSYPTMVVEYAPGHLADAQRVARSLAVGSGEVRPIEPSPASLTSGTSVVVVVGAAQAAGAQTPGSGGESGSQGTGESGSSGTGEAPASGTGESVP